MTAENAQGWWLFGGYAANMVAQFADSYLTAIGTDHGFKEGNPVTRYLLSKIGEAGTNTIKLGFVPLVFVIVEHITGIPGWLNGLMAAATVPIVVRNFLLLRKNKISIKW